MEEESPLTNFVYMEFGLLLAMKSKVDDVLLHHLSFPIHAGTMLWQIWVTLDH